RARVKNVGIMSRVFGDFGGEVNLHSYLTFFILICRYRSCSTLSILPVRLRCGKRGDRPPPFYDWYACRFTDEASQQKEQVFEKVCGIGNRQVTRHDQATHGCKNEPDDRTTVPDAVKA